MKKQLNLETAYIAWADVPSDNTRVGYAFELKFDNIPFGLWVDVYGTFEEVNIDYFTDESCDEFINYYKKIDFLERYLESANSPTVEIKITREDGKYFIEYEEN